MEITPIAFVQSDFSQKFGIPRQSGRVPTLTARIVFTPPYNTPEAFRQIEGFSHLWVVFDFSQAHREQFSPTVRPPRLGGNTRVGVFASRSPFRPNHLGLSCVKLLAVEPDGNGGVCLVVGGADMLNGTPVYDVKPYIPHADRPQEVVGGYADEVESHALTVECAEELLAKLPPEKRAAVLGCLQEDPRPSYQDDDRTYGMSFGGFNVTFTVRESVLTVLGIEKE